MTTSIAEALKQLAILASYRRVELSDQTAVLWAESISEFEFVDIAEAVQLLGEGSAYMPTLPDLRDTIRECRNDRLRKSERRALESGMVEPAITLEEFLSMRPDYRARVEALGMDGARLRHGAAHGDPAARDKAARALAAAQEAAKPLEPKERLLQAEDNKQEMFDVVYTACGVRAGTAAVQDASGTWVCPRCRSPIKDGCAPQRAREGEEIDA
jgi:hypothetical protein